MGKSRRQRVIMNVGKLEKLGKQCKGKTLIIPGKLLAKGELRESVNVIALEYSAKAGSKVKEAKGSIQGFEACMQGKVKPSEVIIAE